MEQLDTRTDTELARATGDGDTGAFGVLLGRYEAPLLRYIRRIGQCSIEDAQDILQEVFIKMYRGINGYNDALKFSSWAYRIAHNQLMDHFRHQSARPQMDFLEAIEWERLLAGTMRIDRTVADQDCLERIREVIGTLPLVYREILILRFLEEQTYEEIMDVLQKPKGSVATLIARGRKLLLRGLKEQGINCNER